MSDTIGGERQVQNQPSYLVNNNFLPRSEISQLVNLMSRISETLPLGIAPCTSRPPN